MRQLWLQSGSRDYRSGPHHEMDVCRYCSPTGPAPRPFSRSGVAAHMHLLAMSGLLGLHGCLGSSMSGSRVSQRIPTVVRCVVARHVTRRERKDAVCLMENMLLCC